MSGPLAYYLVYSMITDQGTAVGRCDLDCTAPIDSARRIHEVEAAVLKDAQAKDPSARNLFLTWWMPIRFEPTAVEPRPAKSTPQSELRGSPK